MIILDILAASLFVVCMTVMTLLQLMGKLRHPTRKIDLLYTIVGIIAITSLLYLTTLRLVPYAWMLMKGML